MDGGAYAVCEGVFLGRSASKYLIVILIGVALGYALGLSSIDVSEYESKIRALKAETSDLQSKLEQAYSEIKSLQDKISNLSRQLRILGTEQLRILGVYFSPRGGCEDEIIHWIDRANRSIHILIYSFTLDSIGDALIRAHKRGVEVKVVFEEAQITRYSEYQRLKAAGIDVRNDTNPRLMHDKVMIIDGIIVITGSYNYSRSAEEYNNENLIVILSDRVASIYEKEFQKIWRQSRG